MAGTLLRGGPSLLARNEHPPCEMVVPELFFPPFLTLNYRPFSSKSALIALSGESGGKGPPMERMSCRVTWQGDWLMATLAALI